MDRTVNVSIDKKLKELLASLKSRRVGVFVDDANLYHAYKTYGWRIDFKRFREFLKKYCDVQFINYYVAIPDKSDASFSGTQKFLKYVKPYVKVKRKKLKYIPVAGKMIKKGDVDVEITLDVVRSIDGLDVVVIVSGDSDYLELRNYVLKGKKKEIVFVGYKRNMAWELRLGKHILLDKIKKQVILR